MKKVISLFLALVMTLSLAMSVFAANTNITLDEAVEVSLTEGDIAIFAFTPEENGVYQFTLSVDDYAGVFCAVTYSTMGNAFAEAGVYYLYDDPSDNYTIESKSFKTQYFCGKAGKTVKFFVQEKASDLFSEEEIRTYKLNTTVNAALKVEKADLDNVISGGTYTSDAVDMYYVFQPTESGYYNFRSFDSDGCDPAITIKDSDGFMVLNNNIGYKDDHNFDATAYMQKGEAYLINVYDYTARFFSDPDKEVHFNFKITDGSGIEPESLYPDDSKIRLNIGDRYDADFFLVPSGAVAKANIAEAAVISSRPRVANATLKFNEEYKKYYVELEAYRLGITTVTIELPNGLSCDIRVIVEPTLITSLRNFFIVAFAVLALPFAYLYDDILALIQGKLF